MIIRNMPGSAGGGFELAFQRYWPRENNILCATTRAASYSPYPQCLSIKAARHGRETFGLETGSATVDDHVYLILNGSRPYGSEIHSQRAVDTFSIFFRPGLAEDVHLCLVATADELLDTPHVDAGYAPEFYEHVLDHDNLVSPVLRYIEKTCRSGFDDPEWYEEECRFLLQKMLQKQLQMSDRIESIAAVKRSTRVELFRRLLRATDYMHASYDRPVALEDIAARACLTPHHFLCVFKQVFAITPYQFVLRKRVAEAQRLLSGSQIPITEIGAQIGFESRSSFFRCFCNLTGRSPQSFRGARSDSPAKF
ncbi:MAG: helix-turn-helix transcriptional regulator [Gammaproteobacteria bacterium]|nr:helix-turn-helix transcriptional regulator [Gammaproteobacteria bacterium]